MSVTIMPVNCPVVELERFDCMYCSDGALDPKCPDCSGLGYFAVSGWLFQAQFSNSNFYSFMAMLGYKDMECCGGISGEEIVKMRRAIMHARNSGKVRGAAVRPTVEDGNFIDCGYSAVQINEQLERLDAVLRWAQEHNEAVSWG